MEHTEQTRDIEARIESMHQAYEDRLVRDYAPSFTGNSTAEDDIRSLYQVQRAIIDQTEHNLGTKGPYFSAMLTYSLVATTLHNIGNKAPDNNSTLQ